MTTPNGAIPSEAIPDGALPDAAAPAEIPDQPTLSVADAGSGTVTATVAGTGTITLYYKKSTDSEWSTGDSRSGDGVIAQTGLSRGTIYYFYAVAVEDGLSSGPSDLIVLAISRESDSNTLREEIVDVLNTDAILTTSGTLGYYLGQTDAKPYGIYYVAPPENVNTPYIYYQFVSEIGDLVKEMVVNITVVANDVVGIHDRIKYLLHNVNLRPSNMRFLMCKREWVGPEIWDDDKRTYSKSVRYVIKAA